MNAHLKCDWSRVLKYLRKRDSLRSSWNQNRKGGIQSVVRRFLVVSAREMTGTALANIEEAIILVLEEFDDKKSDAFAGAALEAKNGIPFPAERSDQALLNEIWEITQAQREDGLPVRIEIEQVEVNSPVSA